MKEKKEIIKNAKLTQKRTEKENNGTNSRWDRQKTNSKMMVKTPRINLPTAMPKFFRELCHLILSANL